MKNILLEILLLLVFISAIKIFPQEIKTVSPIATDSSYSEINPYLTRYWYNGMNNNYYISVTNNNDDISPIWLTFVETDFENFNRIVAYNLQLVEIKPFNKFIISDTLKNITNRNPKIENFLRKPVAVWEGRDSFQTDLYFSIFSDSVWSKPQKITNDSLTETSFVFYTRDAWDFKEQTNTNNILFWVSNSSIMFTSLTPEFVWDSIKTLYSCSSEITNLAFRTNYNNDSYLFFTENKNDSGFVKSFIKYKDSANWIGPIIVISSDTLITQVEANINYDGLITLTYVKGNKIYDASLFYKDSLNIVMGNYEEITDSMIFTSNSLTSGGCIISPIPYFLIATKNDTNRNLTLTISEFPERYIYNIIDYHTKEKIKELSLSGLNNYNYYFVSWSEYDGKQYDIYLYSDYIPFGAVDDKKIKEKIFLKQNYPNPFNPTTTIQYTIPIVKMLHATSPQKNVQLKVFDVLGKKVAILVNRQQKPGTYQVTYDASNLSSGVYYYQLKVGSFVETKKMILLR